MRRPERPLAGQTPSSPACPTSDSTIISCQQCAIVSWRAYSLWLPAPANLLFTMMLGFLHHVSLLRMQMVHLAIRSRSLGILHLFHYYNRRRPYMEVCYPRLYSTDNRRYNALLPWEVHHRTALAALFRRCSSTAIIRRCHIILPSSSYS